jgi:outer membrane protein assembly factor BamB
MTSRAWTTIILAVVLIIVVMLVAWSLAAGGRVAQFTGTTVWELPSLSAMESMQIVDVTGDGAGELFVQNASTLAVLNSAGQEQFRIDTLSPLATTLGDVNQDGVEDIVAAMPQLDDDQPGVALFVFDGTGESLGSTGLRNVTDPSRVAVIRFPSGPQIVFGDTNGQLVAVTTGGTEAWRAQLSTGDYIRGLDDALVDGQRRLAAANHDGQVALYDEQGTEQWTYQYNGLLRRLRAYDLDGDGTSEILLGGDNGDLVMLDAATGNPLVDQRLGQAIVEVREVEIDGRPNSREFVVGGKDGGVWGYDATGRELWSSSVPERVYGIVAQDIDDDGREEAIVGDETGGVTVFSGPDGSRYGVASFAAAITRLDAGRLSGSNQVAVAFGDQVALQALQKEEAPAWYSPLLAGILLSLIIAGVAWFVATMPRKPALRLAVEDQSAEGMQARRRMLHENIADVERLKAAGEIEPQAYLARLRELRSELADNEAAMQKAGVPVRVETFKCPNCGGTLPLGIDRCDYCGQVVIT